MDRVRTGYLPVIVKYLDFFPTCLFIIVISAKLSEKVINGNPMNTIYVRYNWFEVVHETLKV